MVYLETIRVFLLKHVPHLTRAVFYYTVWYRYRLIQS